MHQIQRPNAAGGAANAAQVVGSYTQHAGIKTDRLVAAEMLLQQGQVALAQRVAQSLAAAGGTRQGFTAQEPHAQQDRVAV